TIRDFSSTRLKYIAGHITRMKKRNASSFEHMSEAAGANNTDKGLSMLGALYNFTPNINIGAINYQAWDVMSIFYTEGNAAWEINADTALGVSVQFTDQRSTGDELIGNFETGMAGIKLDASYKNAILTLARTTVDNDAGVRSPFGGYPGYASVIVQDFNRAGEDAWLVGLSYKFSRFGLDGLSAFTNFIDSDTPDNGSAASPDQQELDFTVDYRFSGDLLEGLWIRARAAFVDQDGSGAEDINDYRIILNYSIPLH
ncbi:MAG: OprD family porin, partial [Gammaproteobacteria bacterium]|nr:OprD family porin [Gammaproteobacteria bacterium]